MRGHNMNYDEAKNFIYYGNNGQTMSEEDCDLLNGFLSHGKTERVVSLIKQITDCDDITAKAIAFDLQKDFPQIYKEDNLNNTVNRKCERCGNNLFKIVPTEIGTCGVCTDCGLSVMLDNSTKINIPKCPICGSSNLEKISTVTKATKIGFFGIFGMGDLSKTWKCKNCGSRF